MNCLPLDASAVAGGVVDLLQHRVERALRERVRYRYVHPRVLREGMGYRIESPCCSRNVDPEGGVIDIALLQPVMAAGVSMPEGHGSAPALWQLQARDHVAQCWSAPMGAAPLDDLLDQLCVDAERVFWP